MTAGDEPRWDAPDGAFARYWQAQPLWAELDIRLEAAAPGSVRLALSRNGRSVGGIRNSINGGVLATLAEVAAHTAVRTVLEPGARIARTQDLGLSFATSALAERTVVDARVVRSGRTSVVVVEIADGDDGHLNCAARVTCIVERVP